LHQGSRAFFQNLPKTEQQAPPPGCQHIANEPHMALASENDEFDVSLPRNPLVIYILSIKIFRFLNANHFTIYYLSLYIYFLISQMNMLLPPKKKKSEQVPETFFFVSNPSPLQTSKSES
jgi:hypothetical protein